ncbi:MAG: hypothetical protein ACFFDT_12725 [Candidatus Hodarchaeota archaeon]
MKKQILLVYLAIILLLQSKMEALSILLIITPLIVLSYAILIRKKSLGIIGFALFQFIALPTVKLLNYENIVSTLFIVILMIIPSLILLKIILDLENKKTPMVKPQAEPILIIILILTTIIGVLFILTQISLFDIYLQAAEATTIQILLLAVMTLITCTPFLEKTKI